MSVEPIRKSVLDYPNKPWTEDDDDAVRSLLLAGKSPAVIGTKLKRSTSAIITRSYMLGVSVRRRQSTGDR